MEKLNEEIFTAIHESIGTASMCWSEAPKGVFESEEAAKVAQKLCDKIHAEMMPRPKTFKHKLLFGLKHTLIGMVLHAPFYFFSAYLLYIAFFLVYPITYFKCLGIYMILRIIRVTVWNHKSYEPKKK